MALLQTPVVPKYYKYSVYTPTIVPISAVYSLKLAKATPPSEVDGRRGNGSVEIGAAPGGSCAGELLRRLLLQLHSKEAARRGARALAAVQRRRLEALACAPRQRRRARNRRVQDATTDTAVTHRTSRGLCL